MTDNEKTDIQTWKTRFFLVGIVGLIVSVLGVILDRHSFAVSYLSSFLFWLGLTLGCLPVVMLHHLTDGGWGYPIRRIEEMILKIIPWMALAFLPVAFNMNELYEWSRPEVMAHDHLLQKKALYLNDTFFFIRAGFYFVVWTLLGLFLVYNARKFDGTREKRHEKKFRGRLQGLSGAGLVLYGLTVSFAAMDWGMSLEPHWYSTIYGFLFLVGQTTAGFSFSIVAMVYLNRRKALGGTLTPDRSHDMGNLLFAFIMLWAYIALSQFIIVWSGNLAEETPWYIRRFGGGWQVLSMALTFFHFVIPFFLLLGRELKRNPARLVWIAWLILIMRYVDIYWLIRPAFSEHITFHWLDLATMAALGGFWLAFLFSRLSVEPLSLSHDPESQRPEGAHE